MSSPMPLPTPSPMVSPNPPPTPLEMVACKAIRGAITGNHVFIFPDTNNMWRILVKVDIRTEAVFLSLPLEMGHLLNI